MTYSEYLNITSYYNNDTIYRILPERSNYFMFIKAIHKTKYWDKTVFDHKHYVNLHKDYHLTCFFFFKKYNLC